MKENKRAIRIGHASFPVSGPGELLEVEDACARFHGSNQRLGNGRRGLSPSFRIALGFVSDNPRLAAIPAIKIDGAVTIEHDVRAGFHLTVLETGREHDRLVGATRMAPDHATGITHEPPKLSRRACVGDVEITPRGALLP